MIEEILAYNESFVKDEKHHKYSTTKYPNKKLAILSCMDTRLTELLPAALNVKNGDIKIIKNAGAIVSHPFGSVMRSLIVAVYELGVENILVIGHTDCGMQNIEPAKLVQKMIERNIPKEKIDMVEYCGIDLHHWLKGFENVEDSVRETVQKVKEHPFMPSDISVYGMVMNPDTGELKLL